MNIFAVDIRPQRAAKALGDKHVNKMILETAQMMCSAYPKGDAPYLRAYYNHPCTIWARKCLKNYEWLYHHGMALGKEKVYRFGGSHASIDVIQWCWDNISIDIIPESSSMTPFAQAMPEEFYHEDSIVAYRSYYRSAKSHLHKWTKRQAPAWLD